MSRTGLVAGQQNELRSSGAKANHSLRETRKYTQSESLEGIGVELNGGSEVSLGDSDENVSDRHFGGLKRLRIEYNVKVVKVSSCFG